MEGANCRLRSRPITTIDTELWSEGMLRPTMRSDVKNVEVREDFGRRLAEIVRSEQRALTIDGLGVRSGVVRLGGRPSTTI